ncbi:amidase family protein [Corynebacterium sp. CCM 8835]|uniref:amidase n=1 Tax=Corynebacterium antarcticum TaxID=2800405 RepID=A0A9Q4CD57_9CORY|nr:amidase family protein [Corynebacterium antarcticum]MCK7643182.1 amidase family protein [Corynebacterium antarcticum]MCK7661685.1 amidase family protein [Corynebacterium antarcticum]MCL0246656.1 amidase family protein [Corynebacterium antarcticum]MCX7492797.1 amidase family protein [Corynebacterium antarcticum]MCX7538709.1 amidase family protein [Corynebacterium antarcticum]
MVNGSAVPLVDRLHTASTDLARTVERHLSDITGVSSSVNGFAAVDPDIALQRAQFLDAVPVDRRGRLHGLVLPVKDLMPVSGLPCSYGSVTRTEIPVDTDPWAAQLLREGVVIPGKTQTSEMGMTAYCEPVGMPAVANPLWPGRTPGGSSGGAAAAVALGLVDVAHASDGGGSIRVPAASTGTVGVKPPHDSTGGSPTTQGFITRSVADAAFVFGVRPVHRRLRVGVLVEPLHGDGSVSPEMVSTVFSVADRLSDLGHRVREVSRPYGERPFAAFADVLASRSIHIPGPASDIIEWLRERGAALPEARRAEAVADFDAVPGTILSAWDIDVLLTPTLAHDPPEIGHFSRLEPPEDFAEQTRWTPWATLFNMTGGAAVNVPVAVAGRPPVGVHLGSVRATFGELLGVASQVHP